jgi:hypothetical protein
MTLMKRRAAPIIAAVSGLLLLSPKPVLAQWIGWFQFGTQGSYVHQGAHLLFAAAMIFFIIEIHQAGLANFRGFRCLIWAWVVLAWWNLDAFVGHIADWTLTNPVILGHGFSREIVMYDFHTWLFYVTKIDHFLLLVPAFYLFYRGLKILVRDSQAERP